MNNPQTGTNTHVQMVCQASSGRVVTEYWSQLSDSSDSCSVYGTILLNSPNGSSYLCHSLAYLSLSRLLKNSLEITEGSLSSSRAVVTPRNARTRSASVFCPCACQSMNSEARTRPPLASRSPPGVLYPFFG